MDWIIIARFFVFVVAVAAIFVMLAGWRYRWRAWRTFGLLSVLALTGVVGAFGQAVVLPRLQNLGLGDAVQVIPGGNTSARSAYVAPGDIAGQEKYSYQVPVTAFTITPANFISLLYLNPAGTLATGTLTLQANPSDRQKFCLQDTQTQTAITIAASTGQTLSAGTFGLATPTALVANTRYCWLYLGALSTWTRTQ